MHLDEPGEPAAVARAAAEVAAGQRFVVCELGAGDALAIDLVDQLARLRLLARRSRCRLEIRTHDAEVRQLLELAGLADVLLRQR